MRRSRLTSFLLITAMNFALGIFVLASITTLLEKRTPHHKEAVDSSSASLILNDNQRLAKRSLLSGHVDRNKLLVQRDKFLTSSDFYFRVELKISRAECSSIEFFNNSATLHSIEQMVFFDSLFFSCRTKYFFHFISSTANSTKFSIRKQTWPSTRYEFILN